MNIVANIPCIYYLKAKENMQKEHGNREISSRMHQMSTHIDPQQYQYPQSQIKNK